MKEGSTRAAAIQLSDDETEPVFRLSSRIPARKALKEADEDVEEGQSMDLSFGDAETEIRLEEELVPTAGTLGDFDDVWALLKAQKEKLERIRVIRGGKEKPDLLVIPHTSPAKQHTGSKKLAQPAGSSARPIDVDAMDMMPLKEALGSISSSMAPRPAVAIAPLSFNKPVGTAKALPAHVVHDQATTTPSSAPPTPALTEADTSSASSSHQPSPLHKVRYASADYDDRLASKPSEPRRSEASKTEPVHKPKLPMPVRERAASLLQKLGRQFPEERGAFARAEALGAIPPPEGSRPSVYIFLDFSNVHVGFLEWCKSQGLYDPRARHRRRPKLDLHSLFAVLERGRAARRRILVGSRPLAQGLELAEEWRYELHILDRVRRMPRPGFATDSGGSAEDSDADGYQHHHRTTMREQAVDEVLQLKIYETVTRPPSNREAGRPVVVLATGDGNRGEFSEGGFIAPVRIALAAGFDVEVFSFRAGLSSAWHAEQRRSDNLLITHLDAFGDELVAS